MTSFEPQTPQQRVVKEALESTTPIVFLVGPAGCGKTFMACSYAVEQVQKKHIQRIVVTRPTVGCDESLGYLPGTLDDKMLPWMIPVFDVFHDTVGRPVTSDMQRKGSLEICPLAYMRGRTFKDTILIVDEAQNTTPSQMKLLLTRIGEGSRVIVTGDLGQSDIEEQPNGLQDVLDRVIRPPSPFEHLQCVYMSSSDIQRHAAVEEILEKVYNQ